MMATAGESPRGVVTSAAPAPPGKAVDTVLGSIDAAAKAVIDRWVFWSRLDGTLEEE